MNPISSNPHYFVVAATEYIDQAKMSMHVGGSGGTASTTVSIKRYEML